MQLSDWDINGQHVRGRLHGGDKYPEGTFVETSRVMAVAYDGEMLLVRTEHSVYECFEKDYVGDPEQLLIFIRTMVDDVGGTTKSI